MKTYLIISIAALAIGGAAYGQISDDFEDGVMDTGKWVVGGSKGGVGGSGSGGGQWFNQEVVAADGYLQARATTPLSGNTYGADGWSMTKYNFNDGKDWVMTFKWEADIQSSTAFPTWPGATTPWHADYHLIEITDGRTDWVNGIYLHPPDQRLSGTVWLYETNGVEMGPVTWSIVINSQAKTATLYEGPNGTGSVHSTVTLDTNLPWHVRFITVVGTSLGFGAKDCRINLYNFSATSESPEPPTLPVSIDLKPGSCPNPLNVKDKGLLSVAILGAEDFDVWTIDTASIRLEGTAPVHSTYEDAATPASDTEDECECTTEGPDGYLDLVLKFNIHDIVATLGQVNDGDLLHLTLTGTLTETFGGTPIEGTDCVVIIAKGGK